MLKRILIAVGVIILLIIGLLGVGAYYFYPSADKITEFIKSNPERTAILLHRNDSTVISQNEHRLFPLASTVKIILAIEYAIQIDSDEIDPDELIKMDALDQYYVPNTDGGAHLAWKNSLPDSTSTTDVRLKEVVNGMIQYSSNANTEWLLFHLGPKKVNARIDSLGIKNHTEIYPFVSSLFVGKELFPNKTAEELAASLRDISQERYIETSYAVHQTLKTDSSYKRNIGDLSLPVQRVWSDRLPKSTASEYLSIMKKINSREYFSTTAQAHLDEVMEFILKNPANRKWLEHSGMKGGSTAFLLTKSLYATDKEGNKTEMSYFLTDLSILEKTKLQLSMNEFELNILSNEEFLNDTYRLFNSL